MIFLSDKMFSVKNDRLDQTSHWYSKSTDFNKKLILLDLAPELI